MDARVTSIPRGLPCIGIDALAVRPGTGGVGRAVRHLVEHLPRVAPEFRYLLYLPREAPAPELRIPSAVRCRRPVLPVSLRPARVAWQQAVLPVRLRADRVSLLHAAAYTAPLLTSLPTVLTIYDTIALTHPEHCRRLNPTHFRLLLPRSARRAARIIVPSRATCHDVVSTLRVPPEKVRVIPLGVSPEFRPVRNQQELVKVRSELNLPDRYILSVGNLEPKKNLTTLVAAFAAMRRTGRVTHCLVIAGRRAWGSAEVFRAVKRHRVQDAVHFPGWVPQRLLPLLIAGADVFVFPSHCEGFGLPPLEAMACGTPVVATTTGAVPEVVGDAALTIPPNETRQLAVAVEKILKNEFLTRRLRERGLKRARTFTWERTARLTADVYAEVLAAKQPAAQDRAHPS